MRDERLAGYYRDRAPEYDRIYEKPERQESLAEVRAWLARQVEGERLLELACGTGYWTLQLANHVEQLVATDFVPEVIVEARKRAYPEDIVQFRLADAWELESIPGEFTALYAGFFWSHVEIGRRRAFLERVRQRLGSGAKVVFIDNRYVEGSSTPIARRDDAGNTYQLRDLRGVPHEILKNFPEASELEEVAGPFAEEIEVREFEYYWGLALRLA